MKARSNAERLAVLRADGAPQTAALIELRAFLLRAARYTLSRRWTTVSPASADLNHLAEDAAQEALSALLPRLDEFRGDSRFTTWAYKFAVNAAFVAARREAWRRSTRPSRASVSAEWDRGFPDLPAVVQHYRGVLRLELSAAESADLVEYLKSL